MLTCPQCGNAIDPNGEFDPGGRVGLMEGLTRPSHIGECATMPVFHLSSRVPVVAVPREYRNVDYLKRRDAAQRGWWNLRKIRSEYANVA